MVRKFEIAGRLGKGAYGVVKAIDKKTRSVVALKVLDAFATPRILRTFREIMYLQVSGCLAW